MTKFYHDSAYPPGWGLERSKNNFETEEQLKDIASTLTSEGCIKAITLPDGKMDAPSKYVEQIFGGQYFTQIEIWGAGREGVYFYPGLYNPPSSIQSFCNIIQYENYSYGQEGRACWTRYVKGN